MTVKTTSKAIGKTITQKPVRAPAIPDRAVPRISDCVLSRSSPDGTLNVMRIDSTEGFFSLSGPAHRVWQLIDGKRTLEAIREQVILELDVPRARFAADCRRFFAELVEENYIDLR